MSLLEDTKTLFKREMYIFRSNIRTNVVRTIVFPLIIILIFGSIGQSISNIPLVIVNYANNPQSLSFISQLEGNTYLHISAITDEHTAIGMLSTGKTNIVVVILPTFPSTTHGTAGIQVYYNNNQFTVTSFVIPLVSGIAAKFGGQVQSNVPPTLSPLNQNTQSSGQTSVSALSSSKGSYKDYLVGNIISMVVVFSAMFGGGLSLISDRQLGNLKAFFITPIDKSAIVLSKILSGACFAIVYAFVALALGVLLGAHIAMGLFGLVYVALIAFVIGASFNAVAIIIACRIKELQAFQIIAQAVALPLWIISGGIVPVETLPGWLATLSSIDPLTYSGKIGTAITLQGYISMSNFLFDYGVLVAFALVMILLCFRVFDTITKE